MIPAVSLEDLIRGVVRDAIDDALAKHQGVERVAYSVPEAAESLGVSPDIVRRLIAHGRLPTIDLGIRRQLVPVVALRRFAETNATLEAGEVAA